MKIIIDNECIEIKNCKKFKDRLFGLMFKSNFNYGLLFEKCNSVHTFFMKENIDIIALDKNNNIVKTVLNAKKWRIYNFKMANKIIELPNNSVKDKNINIIYD